MSNGKTFVIAIIALSTLGWIVTTWIRAKHGYPLENEFWGNTTPELDDPEAQRAITLLSGENQRLTGQISRLE